jgi:hypothetical protein
MDLDTPSCRLAILLSCQNLVCAVSCLEGMFLYDRAGGENLYRTDLRQAPNQLQLSYSTDKALILSPSTSSPDATSAEQTGYRMNISMGL